MRLGTLPGETRQNKGDERMDGEVGEERRRFSNAEQKKRGKGLDQREARATGEAIRRKYTTASGHGGGLKAEVPAGAN